MNQREIVNEQLGKAVNKDNVKKVVTMAAAYNPIVGIVAGVVGAVLVSSLEAAQKYIGRVDEIPLIPPESLPILTYNEAISVLTRLGLIDEFQTRIDKATPSYNPVDYYKSRKEVRYTVTFIQKALLLDDPIFVAFFHQFIEEKKYLEIWENRDAFIQFKASLQRALPSVEFTSMAEAIWEDLAGSDEVRESLIGGVSDFMEEFDMNIDIEAIIKKIL